MERTDWSDKVYCIPENRKLRLVGIREYDGNELYGYKSRFGNNVHVYGAEH